MIMTTLHNTRRLWPLAVILLAAFAGCKDVPIDPVTHPIYGPPDTSYTHGKDTVKPGDRPGHQMPASHYVTFNKGDGPTDIVDLQLDRSGSDLINLTVDTFRIGNRPAYRFSLNVRVQMRDQAGRKLELKTQNKNKLYPIVATLRIWNKEVTDQPNEDTVRLLDYPDSGNGFSLSCWSPNGPYLLYTGDRSFGGQPSFGITTVRFDTRKRIAYVSVRATLNTSAFDRFSANFDYRLSY
jgi:hypothetical protein